MRQQSHQEASRQVHETNINASCFYAVSLYVGALKACEDGKAEISQVGIPTFLLIGFSLENAFAAFLIAGEHPTHNDFKKHDLEKAIKACSRYGLIFSKADSEFVIKLNPMHKDFVFRYPEKMERVDLGEMKAAIRTTKSILTDVDLGLKIKGFDVSVLASLMPGDQKAAEAPDEGEMKRPPTVAGRDPERVCRGP